MTALATAAGLILLMVAAVVGIKGVGMVIMGGVVLLMAVLGLIDVERRRRSWTITREQQIAQKQAREDLGVRLWLPYFWKTCDNCGAKVRGEDIWRAKVWHFVGHIECSGYYLRHYLCLSCAPTFENAVTYFRDLREKKGHW